MCSSRPPSPSISCRSGAGRRRTCNERDGKRQATPFSPASTLDGYTYLSQTVIQHIRAITVTVGKTGGNKNPATTGNPL